MSDVDMVCDEIISQEQKNGQGARIDYLMLSQGGSIFLPRTGQSLLIKILGPVSNIYPETKEGIDVTMSLMYYSRMRAITKLLPLLLKSDLPARVVSVYAAGTEKKIFPEDLSLRDPGHYSYAQARSHMVYMHTLFMEALAERNGHKLALIHIFPGLVLGPGFDNPELPALFRFIWRWIFTPLFGRFLTIPPDDCGDRMLSLTSQRYSPNPANTTISRNDAVIGTNGKPHSGIYSLMQDGENNMPIKHYALFNRDKTKKLIWDHTNNAFAAIQDGGIFRG
jgi:hypothetical protein